MVDTAIVGLHFFCLFGGSEQIFPRRNNLDLLPGTCPVASGTAALIGIGMKREDRSQRTQKEGAEGNGARVGEGNFLPLLSK